MMMMMSWTIYIAPYCEKRLKDALHCTICKKDVFHCFLNESKQLVNLMSAGRLFHTAGPATAKALSPYKLFVERLGSVNRPAVDAVADTEADRSVATHCVFEIEINTETSFFR